MIIKRFLQCEDGTFSTIHHKKEFLGFGLEPKNPLLKPGKYKTKIYASPKNKCLVFLFLNVPGHSFVEIHPGNTSSDTQGCVVVGDRIDFFYNRENMKSMGVGNSKYTLSKLIRLFPEGADIHVK